MNHQKAAFMIRTSIALLAVTLPLLIVGPVAHAQSYNANGTTKASPAGSSKTVILAPELGSTELGSTEKELITRQQQRMDLFGSDLQDLRGIVERGLRDLQMQVGQLSNSTSTDESEISGDIRALQDKVERLADTIAITNRRMERTLEITSDVEFRLLRMEKRMQAMMTLGGEDQANAAVQQDTLPPVPEEQITMQRNIDDGSVTWSADQTKLAQQLLEQNEENGAAPADGGAATAPTDLAATATLKDTTATDATANPAVVAPTKPQILPDANPAEQYKFALGKALQNDLETAEKAFAEFRFFNKGHEREPDAAFWLGRVQFMRGSYEKAAMTFSAFNSDYPNDARLVDTTMWIAESVSHFAPRDQACDIYSSLPSLLESPPASFTTRLAQLSTASNCGG